MEGIMTYNFAIQKRITDIHKERIRLAYETLGLALDIFHDNIDDFNPEEWVEIPCLVEKEEILKTR